MLDEKRLAEIRFVLSEGGATETYEMARELLAEVDRLCTLHRDTHLVLAAIVQREGGGITLSERELVAVDPRTRIVSYNVPSANFGRTLRIVLERGE